MTGIKPTRWDKVYKDFKGKRTSVWKEDPTPFFIEKIPFLEQNNVKNILDAGCGDGRNLVVFAEAGFNMTGVDSSKEACKKAEIITKPFTKTTILQQNLNEITFNNKFDAIICDYVMVHLEEGEKIIQNFYNALKKDGYLLVEFLSTDDPSCGTGEEVGKNAFLTNGIFNKFYSQEDAKKILSSFDILDIIKTEHQDPDHVADYPRSEKHTHDSIYFVCKKK